MSKRKRKKSLETTVSDEIHYAFNAHAKKHNKTTASLLMILVESFLKSSGDIPNGNNIEINHQKVLLTRLKNEQEVKGLKKILDNEKANISEYLYSLIRNRINKEPHFIKTEMNELRNSNNQLLMVGRNINQIARAINGGKVDKSELDFSLEYLELVKKRVMEQAQAISALIKKNIERGVADAE